MAAAGCSSLLLMPYFVYLYQRPPSAFRVLLRIDERRGCYRTRHDEGEGEGRKTAYNALSVYMRCWIGYDLCSTLIFISLLSFAYHFSLVSLLFSFSLSSVFHFFSSCFLFFPMFCIKMVGLSSSSSTVSSPPPPHLSTQLSTQHSFSAAFVTILVEAYTAAKF